MTAAQTQFRLSLICEIGRCEFCGLTRVDLALHEVARGGSRQEALDKRYAVVCLCDDCHASLHRMAGDDQRALGLALIKRNRPADYSLSQFHLLTDRNYPSAESVTLWLRRLNFVPSR